MKSIIRARMDYEMHMLHNNSTSWWRDLLSLHTQTGSCTSQAILLLKICRKIHNLTRQKFNEAPQYSFRGIKDASAACATAYNSEGCLKSRTGPERSATFLVLELNFSVDKQAREGDHLSGCITFSVRSLRCEMLGLLIIHFSCLEFAYNHSNLVST